MTDNDKSASIEYILSQGFVKPMTFWERFSKMYRILGWKFIFWDFSYSLIFIAITLLGAAYLFSYAPIHSHQYSVAVGFSPILFMLIMLFSQINEQSCRLYELKQTCRFTSRQITALRCIFYSVAGAAFAVTITAFSTESAAQFFRLLPLCLGGVFLCATIELSVVRLSHSKWAIVAFSIIWTFANLALPFIFDENWELFLSGLPPAFTIAFAISGVAVLVYQISKMLKVGNRYAYA